MFDDRNDEVDQVVKELKTELYEWCDHLSFSEIQNNPRLIDAIERLEDTFSQEYGIHFRGGMEEQGYVESAS